MMSDIIQQAQPGQQQAEPLRVLTYLIQYNNLIYKFHGLSTKADFNNYFSSFQSSMRSFKTLTDQAKIDKKPTLIKVVENKGNAPLQQILTQYNMPAARHKELAIINGMELNTVVESGTLVKVFGGQY